MNYLRCIYSRRSDNSSKIQSINLARFYLRSEICIYYFFCAAKQQLGSVVAAGEIFRLPFASSTWFGEWVLSCHHREPLCDDALVNSISAGWPARPEHICGPKCRSPGLWPAPAAAGAGCYSLIQGAFWSVNHVALRWMMKMQKLPAQPGVAFCVAPLQFVRAKGLLLKWDLQEDTALEHFLQRPIQGLFFEAKS